MKIKCKNIKYDLDEQDSGMKLPSSMTVEIDDSYMKVLDEDEMNELVEESIEEKAGQPVQSFKLIMPSK